MRRGGSPITARGYPEDKVPTSWSLLPLRFGRTTTIDNELVSFIYHAAQSIKLFIQKLIYLLLNSAWTFVDMRF